MRRLIKARAIFGALSLALVTANVRPVLADAGGPNVVYLTITCAGVTYDVVSPSEASAIAQVVDSNNVSVASLIVVTIGSVTFTIPYGPGHGAAVGIQDDIEVCTATQGPATLTVYQFMTPRE